MDWEQELIQKISRLGVSNIKNKNSISQLKRDGVIEVISVLLNKYYERDNTSNLSQEEINK